MSKSYDTAGLTLIRTRIRQAIVDLKPIVTSTEAKGRLAELDDFCIELTNEIEAFEPELPFRVGGGMHHGV